jgi:hypothetical protein
MASERKTPWQLIAIVIVTLLVGIGIGAVVGATLNAEDAEDILASEKETERLQRAVDHAEERMWKLYREREALEAQLDEAASASGDGDNDVADGVLRDGVYLVGEDIQPGEYEGVPTGDTGYWARLKNLDGTVNSIIANSVVTGPFVVTVIESDRALELSGVELAVD